jgi:hypothetical protein
MSKLSALTTILLAISLQVAHAQQPDQRTFPSAEEASEALFVAVAAGETGAITLILGPQELATSSDLEQDKLDRDQFARKYREMHRLARQRDGAMVLYIGAENWPFPIPLTFHEGAWRYDAEAGQQEVLYRRIGENELTAIETLKKPQPPASLRGYTFRALTGGALAYPTVYGSSGVMTFMVGGKGVVYQKDLGANTKDIATALTTSRHDSTWKPAER